MRLRKNSARPKTQLFAKTQGKIPKTQLFGNLGPTGFRLKKSVKSFTINRYGIIINIYAEMFAHSGKLVVFTKYSRNLLI